jgi:tetratricopeptide (TPR) repeat protein
MRLEVMRRQNLDNFEFSQSYAMFWDKFEKANYFYESILDTLDEPTDGRLIDHLLTQPMQDGGQWDMFCALTDKYGAVPKDQMPETFHSSNSGMMDKLLTLKLRQDACALRERHGLTYFSFRDDTFTANRGRILQLMDLIRESGLHPLWNCQSRVNLVDEDRLVAMKRAGCEFMQFGVEHGSERVLKLLDKGTNMRQAQKALGLVRKVGMNLGIYLITGIPGETWEDVEITSRFIQDVRPHDVQISPLALYPGTRLFDRYRAEGRIGPDFYRCAGDAEVFARVDAHTERALRRLDEVAGQARRRALYTPAEFEEQKKWLGFCAVTNLLCGEAAEELGRPGEAEDEYTEIIRREPQNTWGFLKRALLRERAGRLDAARADLAEVLRLAPGNPEATGLARQWEGQGRGGRRWKAAQGPMATMKGGEAFLKGK